jgi:ribosomal protein S19E (S16A)
MIYGGSEMDLAAAEGSINRKILHELKKWKIAQNKWKRARAARKSGEQLTPICPVNLAKSCERGLHGTNSDFYVLA